MQYEFAYCTDKGKKRTINQDSLLLEKAAWGNEEVLLAVLCDGMGGLTRGELASASVVRAFSEWFEGELPGLLEKRSGGQVLFASWEALLHRVNLAIGAYGQRHRISLGTTVTGMLFLEKQYYIVHVGDCRVYEIADRIVQLTRDQTLVQQEMDRGLLTKEEADRDAGNHVLLQCVGASWKVRPAFRMGRLKKDALYLLCCDGFRHVVSPKEMLSALSLDRIKDREILSERLQGLIRLNRARNEKDDITALGVYTGKEKSAGRERCFPLVL